MPQLTSKCFIPSKANDYSSMIDLILNYLITNINMITNMVDEKLEAHHKSTIFGKTFAFLYVNYFKVAAFMRYCGNDS